MKRRVRCRDLVAVAMRQSEAFLQTQRAILRIAEELEDPGEDQRAEAPIEEADGLRYSHVFDGVCNATYERVSELEAEVSRLRAEVAGFESERIELETYRRESVLFLEAEHQNTKLAALLVASQRLSASSGHDEALVAITEIVANLIGSEEMGVYSLDASGATLSLLTSVGLDPERFARLDAGADPMCRALATRRTWVAQELPARGGRLDPRSPTACIPLLAEGECTGAIVIFRLLPQKSAVEQLDRELFDLLSAQAPAALRRGERGPRGAAQERR